MDYCRGVHCTSADDRWSPLQDKMTDKRFPQRLWNVERFSVEKFMSFFFSTKAVEKLCKLHKGAVDKKRPIYKAFWSFPHIFSPTAIITT